MKRERPEHEVWVQLLLCHTDEEAIRDFFVRECGFPRDRVAQRMHLTVYYSRRPLPGVVSDKISMQLVVPTIETRFMVMAPGGENPRPKLNPADRKVGIRVRRSAAVMADILKVRSRYLAAETRRVLGARRPSDHRRNAFGARHFQPHMTLLLPGSGVDKDLSVLGKRFRSAISQIVFDQCLIDCVNRSVKRPA